ncbi:MAG: radical SAM protein [Pirellulaceae bacterium]
MTQDNIKRVQYRYNKSLSIAGSGNRVDREMREFTDADILAARGAKNNVSSDRPYHLLVESERSATGQVEDVATVFLTGAECPFRCLVCDLWKNTLDHSTPPGAITRQIHYAIKKLGPTPHIKLYNSSNFFDPRSVPRGDLPQVAPLLRSYKSVIVENHPRLVGRRCVEFQQQIGTQLEIAMGLETSHAPTLQRLNKRMTISDFSNACQFLVGHQIRVRTFILLRPPDTTELEGIQRAIASIRFAFDCGVSCCSVIATRGGNGILDRLRKENRFSSPRLRSLETVQQQAIQFERGRVFADLWDLQGLAECPACFDRRVQRMRRMNLTQRNEPAIECNRCDHSREPNA